MNNSSSPFAHLLGQKRATSLLARSLSSGRVAHAYLFRGPAGVGKKLFAEAMAKALNCRKSGPSGACGGCLSCKKFNSGNHPDYVVESPEKGTIRIDKVRDLCKSLSYPPYESARRIVVLEEIHTMRQEASNSLLKTLEEPPDGNVIILTAETSKNILATISSRCQVIPFFPLSQDHTLQILREKHGLDEETGRLLAKLSEGSPGQALLLHETSMIETWKDVVRILGDTQYKEDRNNGIILQLAQKMAELKEHLIPMLGLLRIWLRDTLVRKTEEAEHKNQQFTSAETIFTKLQAIDRAEKELARNCNRSLVCEILLFRLQ